MACWRYLELVAHVRLGDSGKTEGGKGDLEGAEETDDETWESRNLTPSSYASFCECAAHARNTLLSFRVLFAPLMSEHLDKNARCISSIGVILPYGWDQILFQVVHRLRV